MTTKVQGSSGIQFPDSTQQVTAAIPKTQKSYSFSGTGTSGVGSGLGNGTAIGMTSANLDPDGALSGQAYMPKIAGWYWVFVDISYANAGLTASNLNAMIYKNGSYLKTVGANACSTAGYPGVSGGTIVYMNGTTDSLTPATSHNAATAAASVAATLTAFLIKAA